MVSLGRRIYFQKIPLFEKISGIVGSVLDILAKENIAVKGGFAKIILGEILKSEGKIKENLALGFKGKTDLDLLMTFPKLEEENLDSIAKKIRNLKGKFAKLNINLDEEDVELMEGDLKDIKFVRRFLESRDLTINEIIFIPRSQTLFFTDKCLRDTINAVGILTAGNPKTLRRDCGRIIASPWGMARLIRFLVEKKVKSIYLPNWWILANKEEAEKLGQGILGTYALILIERYKDEESLQYHFMKVLNNLSITNLKRFNTFKKEQEMLFEASRGKKFVLRKRSFKKAQEESIRQEEKRKRIEIEMEKKERLCLHKKRIKFICNHCSWHCAIIKCRNCKYVEIIPKEKSQPFPLDELFCNKNFIRADVYWDKNGFFQAPF
jgi:hypothetical protein